MQEDTKQAEPLSPEIQEAMRALIAAIRAVKLYPPNNPVYAQSVRKAHEALSQFLASAPDYSVGVQKTFFTYQQTPLGKDGQLNKAIAQDLFAKGVRQIVFFAGVTEAEMLELCRGLALSTEDLAMRNGISSILWEKSANHIKIAEAGLEEVIDAKKGDDKTGAASGGAAAKETRTLKKTVVLGDLLTDPSGFGETVLEYAKKTKGENETVEDRLYTLYREAGKKILKDQPGQTETLFEGLAKSVLAIDKRYRDGFVAAKLYGDLDAESAADPAEIERGVPTQVQEVLTGRYSEAWNVKQVATLLKRSTAKKPLPPATPPMPAELKVDPLSPDLTGIVQELSAYTDEDLAGLKVFGESGMESDIIEAAVRTLIHLMPLVKNPLAPRDPEKDLERFSAVVGQLEDMMAYLLQHKQYHLVGTISHAFHQPVEPEFAPRLEEARKKTTSRTMIVAAIGDVRKQPKDSPQYQDAYAYLSMTEDVATEVLLELLAEEKDRKVRFALVELAKHFGRNQIELFGQQLQDSRWYFVRNIVNILGELGTDQAIGLLRKAGDNTNLRVRQEVVKALLTIGGKKAASVMVKFLKDRDPEMQLTALHAFGDLAGIGPEESVPLITFLEERELTKKDHEFTLEAIRTLGKIGGRTAADFLGRYNRIRWWKSRKLQSELRDAAQQALEDIARRRTDGGSAKR